MLTAIDARMVPSGTLSETQTHCKAKCKEDLVQAYGPSSPLDNTPP